MPSRRADPYWPMLTRASSCAADTRSMLRARARSAAVWFSSSARFTSPVDLTSTEKLLSSSSSSTAAMFDRALVDASICAWNRSNDWPALRTATRVWPSTFCASMAASIDAFKPTTRPPANAAPAAIPVAFSLEDIWLPNRPAARSDRLSACSSERLSPTISTTRRRANLERAPVEPVGHLVEHLFELAFDDSLVAAEGGLHRPAHQQRGQVRPACTRVDTACPAALPRRDIHGFAGDTGTHPLPGRADVADLRAGEVLGVRPDRLGNLSQLFAHAEPHVAF